LFDQLELAAARRTNFALRLGKQSEDNRRHRLKRSLSEPPPRERQRQIRAEINDHGINLVYRIYAAIAAERD
jgi:hypothetical protein